MSRLKQPGSYSRQVSASPAPGGGLLAPSSNGPSTPARPASASAAGLDGTPQAEVDQARFSPETARTAISQVDKADIMRRLAGTPGPTASLDTPQQLNATGKPGENIFVSVRFRPLSDRERMRGEYEVWRPEGENGVTSIDGGGSYAYDRVFHAETSTDRVYDVAALDVIWGAMDGLNGTIFAYGVTSSGKTHTMHGSRDKPGMIPLAVNDVFSIIQETPSREFLLRVSYLEIYNEVINDLLDPANTQLRIREDKLAGIFVEGVKEEVVLNAEHVLSLIAAGEAHRHVGATNLNQLSSRSHTIFRLTIESTERAADGGSKVRAAQLNLIDLAGSESSKAETTGLRRREGGYINKSLLTLGTVISKLSEGSASHIPYRDSKLTRLLQSSLTGNARISMVCTVTPSSGASEETHNTLKFASRAKRVELHALRNEILDDKSLIKKYQREIQELRQQLDDLAKTQGVSDDANKFKIMYEEGQMAWQSRLEEEEAEKLALQSKIHRLTKLILVSTRSEYGPKKQAVVEERPKLQRSRSFEAQFEKLYGVDKDRIRSSNQASNRGDEESSPASKEKKGFIRSVRGLFKSSKRHNTALTDRSEHAPDSKAPSPGSSPGSMQRQDSWHQHLDTSAGELFTYANGKAAPDSPMGGRQEQIEMLQEQLRLLVQEIQERDQTLDSLRHDSESSQHDQQKENILAKNLQLAILEQRIEAAKDLVHPAQYGQVIDRLRHNLGEKNFEMQVMAADNNFMKERLEEMTAEVDALRNENSRLAAELNRRGISRPAEAPSAGPAPALVGTDANGLESLSVEELRSRLRQANEKLAAAAQLMGHLEGSDLGAMRLPQLEEIEAMHVHALHRLSLAKAKEKERLAQLQQNGRHAPDDQMCKVCFAAPTAAVLLPCRHFCLCKKCAYACKECPLCRRTISERLITYNA
eukprot:jgi/Chlat1/1607/Chrsp125S01868